MVIRLFGQRLILVNPPAALIRTLILKKILQEKDIEVSDSIDLQMFGTLTYGYNPKELERLCDLASSARLTREVHDEPSSHSSLLKVSQGDLIEAFQRIEPLSSLPLLQSMKDWCESVASVKNDRGECF
ncbi:PREDICTED: uncharacterized protein LOC104774601 [Camelina sativa]|uniref:Uncharacterized protein LOC104774601 n=1 Tax=Camelina sativa TaxID=90675 RepID=A0ABM0Y946_CAMSA|nr:PREDICTED: uncharacterized protein LOC104774601 [Camelina sativa]